MEFNLGTLVTTSIASFITGMAVATVGMLFSFSARLAEFSTTLKSVKEKVDKHTDAPTIICNYHGKMNDDLQEIKTRVALHEEKIDKLEEEK